MVLALDRKAREDRNDLFSRECPAWIASSTVLLF